MDVETLIPHRLPARLVERLDHATDDEGTCIGRIPTDHPMVCQGEASTVLGIELAAQATALFQAHQAASAAGAASPVVGYLTTIRKATLHRPTLPADQPLVASVRLIGGVAPLALFATEVRSADTGAVFLSTVVGTFAAPDATSS